VTKRDFREADSLDGPQPEGNPWVRWLTIIIAARQHASEEILTGPTRRAHGVRKREFRD
jgi:hypothetical protein